MPTETVTVESVLDISSPPPEPIGGDILTCVQTNGGGAYLRFPPTSFPTGYGIRYQWAQPTTIPPGTIVTAITYTIVANWVAPMQQPGIPLNIHPSNGASGSPPWLLDTLIVTDTTLQYDEFWILSGLTDWPTWNIEWVQLGIIGPAPYGEFQIHYLGLTYTWGTSPIPGAPYTFTWVAPFWPAYCGRPPAERFEPFEIFADSDLNPANVTAAYARKYGQPESGTVLWLICRSLAGNLWPNEKSPLTLFEVP